jgi:hypothetical protein
MPGMFNRRAADIILAAPTTWSTTIMTDNRETCVDPYLDSFAQNFAAANYTAGTIRTYRHLARKLGRLMGTGGIAPSALTPDLADQLAARLGILSFCQFPESVCWNKNGP